MTAFSHEETHQTLRALLMDIQGIPTTRAWELVNFTPQPGTPYVEESYAPDTTTQRTMGGTGASMEYRGLYTVRLYGLTKVGPDALHAQADIVLAAFPASASFLMPSGLALRIRGDIAPTPGQLIRQNNGFACCPITIPWRVYT